MSVGVYVHIPFCKSKCKYCDFNSSDKNFGLEKAYVDRIIEEIESSSVCGEADTVFFGGGTPTAMKLENLLKIIDAVNEKYPNEKAEFTVECNPATIDYDGFLALRSMGVNRISLGLQSANDDELAFLGRIHTFADFVKTYSDARRAGFRNINVDLMFSLHKQTMDKWLYTLKKVIELSPEHISCYSLIVEEGTSFYELKLDLPDEETDRDMYYTAVDLLKKHGYLQYEISNFAKAGYECKHNIKYWRRDNYVGFGCGASGLYDGVRMTNSRDIREYIDKNSPEVVRLSKEEEKSEHIFLGLRMTDGFDVAEFNKMYDTDFAVEYEDIIKKYGDMGLLECGDRVKLTLDGLSVSNSVMCEFV